MLPRRQTDYRCPYPCSRAVRTPEEEVITGPWCSAHRIRMQERVQWRRDRPERGVTLRLVAAIAADALGRERVHGIFMPSPYTSRESREDAYGLARKSGHCDHGTADSRDHVELCGAAGSSLEGKRKSDTTEENLQARIRGNLLMAFSNKFGWLVLTQAINLK